ncbi:hypothetical protein L3N51_00597 [Metallosphaera sp. J1]|uniref:hypothetical protein n=1 Tax=Metallosphaera javensis (ex Hofmann et al. 2022) TaxID=99938 RepID=UPI001EDE22AF|nr:hypothetical protein [Metallosphaera javensis (ex Hofmann et al. 2022)]MCG3108316.1 hypothetical protein [Metallosphaera javensis (ex Hofmann et al. 2022)]
MEAYVFWHRRDPQVNRERYEEYLIRFHENFQRVGVRGFLHSTSYRISGVSWMPQGDVYEDWYLIEDSGVLDRLIDAVEKDTRTVHDEIASFSLEGKGTLLALKAGELSEVKQDVATWFSKPRGVQYEKFYASLEVSGSLWRRLLAMGPSPEFCMISAEGVTIPSSIQVKREMIFPR